MRAAIIAGIVAARRIALTFWLMAECACSTERASSVIVIDPTAPRFGSSGRRLDAALTRLSQSLIVEEYV